MIDWSRFAERDRRFTERFGFVEGWRGWRVYFIVVGVTFGVVSILGNSAFLLLGSLLNVVIACYLYVEWLRVTGQTSRWAGWLPPLATSPRHLASSPVSFELPEILRQRRMVRDFTPEPVAVHVVDGLLDGARRAPSAGNVDGRAFVVLQGQHQIARYWDVTLAGDKRASFEWPGLLRAPVLVVVLCSPEAYVARYGEPDKAGTGLGVGTDAWAVPYWHVDAGMAVEAVLLGAVDAGLGASFFGLFEHEAEVLAALGVPDGWRAVGTIALGHPGEEDRPGRSASRSRPELDQVVHRGRW